MVNNATYSTATSTVVHVMIGEESRVNDPNTRAAEVLSINEGDWSKRNRYNGWYIGYTLCNCRRYLPRVILHYLPKI